MSSAATRATLVRNHHGNCATLELISALDSNSKAWSDNSLIVRQRRPPRNIPKMGQIIHMGQLGPEFRHQGHISLQMMDYRQHRGIVASLSNAERIANSHGPCGRAPSPYEVKVEQKLSAIENVSPQRKALVDARRRLDQITLARTQLQQTNGANALPGTYVNTCTQQSALPPGSPSDAPPPGFQRQEQANGGNHDHATHNPNNSNTGTTAPRTPNRHAAYRHRYVVNTSYGATAATATPAPPLRLDSAISKDGGSSTLNNYIGRYGLTMRPARGADPRPPDSPRQTRAPAHPSRVPLQSATLAFGAIAVGDGPASGSRPMGGARSVASLLPQRQPEDHDTHAALFPHHKKTTVSKVAGLIQVRAVSARNRSGRGNSGRRAGSARFNGRKGTQVGTDDAWALNAAKVSYEKKKTATISTAQAVARGERSRVLDGLLFHTAVRKDGGKGPTKTTTGRKPDPKRFAKRPLPTASALGRARQAPNVTSGV